MKYNVETLTAREVFPGFHGRFIHSDRMTLAYWLIEANAIIREHSHPHEQVVNMLGGELLISMNGEQQTLRPGDVLTIPPDVEHSVRALTTCRVLDVFSPVREDYRFAEDGATA